MKLVGESHSMDNENNRTMDRPLKETVYTPQSELANFSRLLGNMVSDISASRGLAWRLLVRNLSARYRQSVLGYAWAFIPPLFTSLVWIFLQSQRVLEIDDTGMPYVAFVICGTVLWQTFVEALNNPLNMVKSSMSMLTKINFPREALILAGIGQVFFSLQFVACFLLRLWSGSKWCHTLGC